MLKYGEEQHSEGRTAWDREGGVNSWWDDCVLFAPVTCSPYIKYMSKNFRENLTEARDKHANFTDRNFKPCC